MPVRKTKVNKYTCSDGKEYFGAKEKEAADIHEKQWGDKQNKFQTEMDCADALDLRGKYKYSNECNDEFSGNAATVEDWNSGDFDEINEWFDDHVNNIDFNECSTLTEVARECRNLCENLGGVDVFADLVDIAENI